MKILLKKKFMTNNWRLIRFQKIKQNKCGKIQKLFNYFKNTKKWNKFLFF